jgi:hypothetical protein
LHHVLCFSNYSGWLDTSTLMMRAEGTYFSTSVSSPFFGLKSLFEALTMYS